MGCLRGPPPGRTPPRQDGSVHAAGRLTGTCRVGQEAGWGAHVGACSSHAAGSVPSCSTALCAAASPTYHCGSFSPTPFNPPLAHLTICTSLRVRPHFS